MFADEFHQFERRARGKLQAFILVKPEGLALRAQIDVDGPDQVAVERHGSHFVGAVWALHWNQYPRRPSTQQNEMSRYRASL